MSRAVAWLRRPTVFRGFALASVIANVVLVVSGGAVRLTNSGLGCPTWPRCTDASLTPTKQYAIHGIIEFSNRQLAILLTIIAAVTLLIALLQRRERLLAALGFAIIPLQAVIGGITVRTDLNPWVVSLHFLTSMPVIAVTLVLWWRLSARLRAGRPGEISAEQPPAKPIVLLSHALLLVTAATLVLGTIVTGSGPHAGDTDSSGKVHRTGLKVSSMSQLHADAVMVLVGLTVGLLFAVYAAHAGQRLRRAVWLLVAVELAQGVIGYVQYFLHVPPLLVAAHMLGACLVWVAALWVALAMRPPLGAWPDEPDQSNQQRRPTPSEQPADRVDHHAHHRADDGAVDPDELQVPAHLQLDSP